MSYLSKNKVPILIEGSLLASLSLMNPSSSTKLLILLLFAVSMIGEHIRRMAEEKLKDYREELHKYEKRALLHLIETLSSEIVYPTWTKTKKARLLDQVKDLKEKLFEEASL